MRSHSDFWLILHQLAGELQREAENPEIRIEQLTAVLGAITPNTRAIYCANLRFVLDVLAELNAKCRGLCDGKSER